MDPFAIDGIRADEPRRVANADVMAFWRSSPFDLALRPGEGNCDLCFLKGFRLRQQIARDRPDLTVWWMQQETDRRATFRYDTPPYADLLKQRDLFAHTLDELSECYCTD